MATDVLHTLSILWMGRLLGTCFVAVLVPLLVLVAYRICLHPLANIPGPRAAAISSIWYAYHVRSGNLYQLGTQLHRQYGPVVRVRPNEIWFDSKEAFNTIYSSTNGYEKSDFYLATALLKPKYTRWSRMQGPDTLDLLAERDMTRYRLQRRLIGPIYNLGNLRNHELLIDNVLDRVVAELRSLDGCEVNLKEWMHIITVECLGAISLSWSPGYLKSKSDGASGEHAYMGWRRRSVFGIFPWAVVMESMSKPAGRLFAILWRVTYATPKRGFRPFFPAVQRKITQRIKIGLDPRAPKDPRRDIVDDLVSLHKSRPEFNEQYLRRMAITNFGAGHETMTSTLISAMTMIGAHERVQQRIHKELALHPWPLRYDDSTSLDYMLASIKEAQRLHPVIGMSLPRATPRTGAYLHGFYIPPGVTVGCNPVSLHRNKDIFGLDSDQYRPERWLDGETAMDMKRCNLIYGGGARTCPGKYLAEFLVTKIMLAILKHFDVKAQVPSDDEIRYFFMAMLTSGKVQLIPKHHEDAS